jgi:hypothetical protein
MPSRPAPVRIDDFSAPRFTDDIAELRRNLVPMAEQIRLEPDALVGEATTATGLDDLGTADDPGWHDRLDLVLRCFREEVHPDAWGTVSNHGLFGQLVRNRLLLADLLKRHPEIHEVEITRPIVVCGLPRTGTTHLHNLLAADPNLRSLPYWESLEPVLPGSEAEGRDDGEPDPRIARTAAAIDMVNRSMPLFVRMHEMTVEHAHEEIQLLAIDMSSMLFETTAPMPSWRDDYRARDQTPSYRYLRTVLQALTWLRGGDRWALKSPQHLEQLGPLASVFPDATFVVTHRDPVEITASVVTMLTYTARMSVAAPDPVAIGRYWAERVEDLLMACLRDHDDLPPAQTVDVRLDDLVADDMAVVEQVYDVAGQPLPESSRAAMAEFAARHPPGRHGTVVADLTAFDLDPDERRKALGPYAERFAVGRVS